MTDTPDWADEAADRLCATGEYVGQCKAIASALRAAFLRGRIEGMREAVFFGRRASADDIEEYIRAAADKLEAGEA